MNFEHPVLRIIVLRTAQASVLAGLLHWLLGWPLTGPCALGLFLTPALCLYFVFVFVAPWAWGLPILTRLRTREIVVALTFDDGPSENTAFLLDSLREYRMTATFFVLGEAVERFPEVMRRMVAEGHTVGVHAWQHQSFVGLGNGRIAEEIQRTQEAVQRACPDVPVALWHRPPYGFKSLRALWVARKQGLRLAAWNLDSRDYRDSCSERIARRVVNKITPGAIVLLHDGPKNAATAEALPRILQELKLRGFQCVSLPPK